VNSIEAAFTGKVGRDAELRQSQAGKPWAAVNVAVGNDENTTWVRVTMFGDLAIEMASRLTKGTSVYCEARNLVIDGYTTSTGEQRHGLKCIATKVQVVGASAIGRNRPQQPKAPPEGEHPAPIAAGGGRNWQRPLGDDAIPFGPAV